MKKRKQNKDSNLIGMVLILWVVITSVYYAIGYVTDAQAEFYCWKLQKQAKEFDGFFLADSQERICDEVGVSVNVRYPDDVMEAREIEQKVKEWNAEQIAHPTFVKPDWYEAQQNALDKDRAYLNLKPELMRICACESVGDPDAVPQQYERDGVTVLRGRITPRDRGMCQINLDYHEETATALGLDVHKPYDNVAYANWLYKNLGSAPWKASQECWDRD